MICQKRSTLLNYALFYVTKGKSSLSIAVRALLFTILVTQCVSFRIKTLDQVAAAMSAAHQESLAVMSKRLAELYSEMGLPVGAGGGLPGQK